MQAIDVSNLPLDLPEEYTLTAGRPGKETGAFEIILSTNRPASAAESSSHEDGDDHRFDTLDDDTLAELEETDSRDDTWSRSRRRKQRW
jgi:hypothetical protein